jgi:hypothetical protein
MSDLDMKKLFNDQEFVSKLLQNPYVKRALRKEMKSPVMMTAGGENYYEKYRKYKAKYLALKRQLHAQNGGTGCMTC